MTDRFRLTENHPTSKKLEKLWAYMDKIGIMIEPMYARQLIIHDVDQAEVLLYLEDLEDNGECVTTPNLPPQLEYKVIRHGKPSRVE